MKYRIQRDYRGRFFAWCSPFFDGSKLGGYTLGADQVPTSDPFSIYRDLANAVNKNDEHNAKIAEQKKNLPALALRWLNAGEIDQPVCDEIVAMVSLATFREWRPLIFVIPYQRVNGRAKLVDRSRRASVEHEYIVEDLGIDEFDIIEP